MPRTTPTTPPTSPTRNWPSEEDRVDGQASGPPVSPGPDSGADARERARRPRFGDADCVFCAGSGLVDGEPCRECDGTGQPTGPYGSE